MIPEEKSSAVARGLREVFGLAEPESIQKMVGGLSSDLVFRMAVQGTPYLLRIITRINEQTDPARHFGSMKTAAEGGIAPRVRYASVEDGIAITDFVETAPLSVAAARARIPPVLRRLHGLARLPKVFNYVTMTNGFLRRFRTAGLLAAEEVEEVFGRFADLAAVYPRVDADMVSCHNDLKPENILFDGDRVWLVDWQAAFVHDRYFDLGVVANFVVTSDAEEAAYLAGYFGQAADEYQRARFFLMRQLQHMMYATVFLLLGSAGRPVDTSIALPAFREFHERILAGEISLANAGTRIAYGRVHWDQLLRNVRLARFDEALGIVSQCDAGARLLPEL